MPCIVYAVHGIFGISLIGDNMNKNKNRINKCRSFKYKVYSKTPLSEGTECFSSSKNLNGNYYITSVHSYNIKCEGNKFYYTNEDLSEVADWWPAHMINVGTTFKRNKKNPTFKYAKVVGDNVGKKIDGQGCLVDVSQLPAFRGMDFNEEVSINEYKFYLTLFNEYSIAQCIYERKNLYDLKIRSSKYDLASKLQNSDFLKSKDFKVINYKRKDEEVIPVGLIIKEQSEDNTSIEYGTVYINMNNKISIVWK